MQSDDFEIHGVVATFERMTGASTALVESQSSSALPTKVISTGDGRDLTTGARQQELSRQVEERDARLRELQHRVKNNLQMIMALIRLEAKNQAGDGTAARFSRLAGRVESLALLYRFLSADDQPGTVDLGVYVSQITSAAMAAQAAEGIRLDLQVDTWQVSIDVATPTGLVINELVTNSLKHAFTGRDQGTISITSLVAQRGCTIIFSDDGIGMDPSRSWPQPGKLSARIVQSLEQNAGATVAVTSSRSAGMRVKIFLPRAAPSRQ